MKQSFLRAGVSALASLLFLGSEVLAQEENAPRFELGAQFSLLSRHKPAQQFTDFVFSHENEPGFGARFTYNLTNDVALDAEGNFFPRLNMDFTGPTGRIYQAQFGVKVGKRFKRFGIFGKLRPGFVRFTHVTQLEGFRTITFIHPFYGEVRYENAEFRIGKETYFAGDMGGVLEFYPSRRIVTRLDLGDTVIRYGVHREPAAIVCALSAPACPREVYQRAAETRHNIQFSIGIGFRF